MSDDKDQDGQGQEPTMEEILASIRRIISDEDEAKDEAGEDAEAEESAVEAEAAAEEEPESESEAEPEPESEAPEDEDVLELSEAEIDEFDDADLEPELAPSVEQEPEPEPVAVDDYEFEEPEPEAPPAAQAPPSSAELFKLLSDQAAEQATGHLAGLTGAVARTRGVPLGNVNKTLEDVVKELLRPMLKDWLDVNLPPLVERIVEKEIVKLVGRAEDD